jgi:type VI secretion system protein ImpK
MQPVQSRQDQPAKLDGGRSNTLALLYQSIFIGIVRLQARRQNMSDPVTFRRRIKYALEDVQRESTSAGYSVKEARDAEAAVVAFLDEAILTLSGPARDKWAEKPLSVELYGEAIAGEVFFERLEELQTASDSPHLADILEVYLLCLLLGFEGKYSGQLRSQGRVIADRVRAQIDGIRGTNYRLSPPLRFQAAAEPEPVPKTEDRRWMWQMAGAAALSILVFVLFKTYLWWRLSDLESMLSQLR